MKRSAWWRWLVAAIPGVVAAVLGFTGVLGGGYHPERYEHWQTVVEPAGGSAVRVTETIDYDFGDKNRRGIFRSVPNDLGELQDISVSSPTAPDELDVEVQEYAGIHGTTRIRIGDPDVTISGKHRYTVSYVLPDAVEGNRLELDIFGGLDHSVATAEVVVSGWQFDNPECNRGRRGSTDPCDTIDVTDGVLTATATDVGSSEAVTIYADLGATATSMGVAAPPLPEPRDSSNRLLTGAGFGAAGFAVAGVTALLMRRRGRNEVFGGGDAADAAFGSLAPPLAGGGATPVESVPTTFVSDDELANLATIEFAPPEGIRPWEGAILLAERYGSENFSAYLSSLLGAGIIELEPALRGPKYVTMRRGANYSSAPAFDRAAVDQILENRDEVTLGSYDSRLAGVWKWIHGQMKSIVEARQWWRRPLPALGETGMAFAILGTVMLLVFGGFITLALIMTGWSRAWIPAALLTAVPAVIFAVLAFTGMSPSRTATGSALALRVESFRQFLHKSEGRHVDWAWEHGLLREYSAWAVALGEADAWRDAMRVSTVPPTDASVISVGAMHTIRTSASSTVRAPSSSGGGGFSGGGGGGAGGGGGGGGGGSW